MTVARSRAGQGRAGGGALERAEVYLGAVQQVLAPCPRPRQRGLRILWVC
jgi:hypothetical protein